MGEPVPPFLHPLTLLYVLSPQHGSNSGGWGNSFRASLEMGTPCISTASGGGKRTCMSFEPGLFIFPFPISAVRPLLCNFGHNDQHFASLPESIVHNLITMLNQICAAGGELVLSMSLTRRESFPNRLSTTPWSLGRAIFSFTLEIRINDVCTPGNDNAREKKVC